MMQPQRSNSCSRFYYNTSIDEGFGEYEEPFFNGTLSSFAKKQLQEEADTVDAYADFSVRVLNSGDYDLDVSYSDDSYDSSDDEDDSFSECSEISELNDAMEADAVDNMLVLGHDDVTHDIIQNLSYVDDEDKTVAINGDGSHIITKMRHKINGNSLIIYNSRRSRRGIYNRKCVKVKGPVGQYEIYDGLAYSFFPVKGKSLELLGVHYYIVPHKYFRLHNYSPPDIDVDGIILSIDGLEYRWKNQWTNDTAVLSVENDHIRTALGSFLRPIDMMISEFRIGRMVELASPTLVFIRFRDDKRAMSISVDKYANLPDCTYFVSSLREKKISIRRDWREPFFSLFTFVIYKLGRHIDNYRVPFSLSSRTKYEISNLRNQYTLLTDFLSLYNYILSYRTRNRGLKLITLMFHLVASGISFCPDYLFWVLYRSGYIISYNCIYSSSASRRDSILLSRVLHSSSIEKYHYSKYGTCTGTNVYNTVMMYTSLASRTKGSIIMHLRQMGIVFSVGELAEVVDVLDYIQYIHFENREYSNPFYTSFIVRSQQHSREVEYIHYHNDV